MSGWLRGCESAKFLKHYMNYRPLFYPWSHEVYWSMWVFWCNYSDFFLTLHPLLPLSLSPSLYPTLPVSPSLSISLSLSPSLNPYLPFFPYPPLSTSLSNFLSFFLSLSFSFFLYLSPSCSLSLITLYLLLSNSLSFSLSLSPFLPAFFSLSFSVSIFPTLFLSLWKIYWFCTAHIKFKLTRSKTFRGQILYKYHHLRCILLALRNNNLFLIFFSDCLSVGRSPRGPDKKNRLSFFP